MRGLKAAFECLKVGAMGCIQAIERARARVREGSKSGMKATFKGTDEAEVIAATCKVAVGTGPYDSTHLEGSAHDQGSA
jgi:hypothetical protein